MARAWLRISLESKRDPYQRQNTIHLILYRTQIHCIIGDKKIRREQREVGVHHARRTLRFRGDRRAQEVHFVGNGAVGRCVSVVKERTLKVHVIGDVDADKLIRGRVVQEPRGDVRECDVPEGNSDIVA